MVACISENAMKGHAWRMRISFCAAACVICCRAYMCRAESIRSALDVLAVCVICSKGMAELCSSIPLPDGVQTPGISILLLLAEGEYLADPDVQRAALHVINNVVCAPLFRVRAR